MPDVRFRRDRNVTSGTQALRRSPRRATCSFDRSEADVKTTKELLLERVTEHAACGRTLKGGKFMAKTISFCQGKGNINHNNRKFVTPNVDKDRIPWDVKYVTESVEEAYEKCFGQALEEYNSKQKREDRKKKSYLEEIKKSKNGEHVFYEDIVQIGTMNDTPVIDENGELTEEAMKAIKVLDEYAKSFQERNPNLYLFNCVLHLDEKTPHLHLDYIPVAEGYSKGLSRRNSISKALQCMGIPKAVSKKENEESLWKNREREYIKELCSERGIEIEELGIKRENYSLPEYREAMAAVDELKAEAETIEESVNDTKKRLEDYAEKEKLLHKAAKKADKEMQDLCKDITSHTTLFSGEEYVKVPKGTWDKILEYCRQGLIAEKWNALFEDTLGKVRNALEEKAQALTNKLMEVEAELDKVFQFIKDQGMMSQYEEYARPKTMKEKLDIAKEKAKELSEKNKNRNGNILKKITDKSR